MEEIKPKHAGGRPTDYNNDLASKICKQLAMGKSLRAVCREDDSPDMSTIYDWLRIYPEFTNQYEQACQDRVEAQLEDLNYMGDEALDYVKNNPDKNTSAVVSAYKLKADNMRWTMSKIKPKKYGDKMDVTSDGKVLPTPIAVIQRN